MNIGRRRNQSWKKWTLLLLVVAFLGLSLKFPGVGESIRNGFHAVLSPIERVVSSIGGSVSNGLSSTVHLFSLKEENTALKKENDRLNNQLLQSQELQEENRRLSELLGYKNLHTDWNFYPVRIIGREGSFQNFFLILSQGSEVGIQKDMPVVDGRGLVGIVRESWSGGARVQMITDSSYAVGAMVQRSGSRTSGVVEGNNDHPATPRLINLSSDADVQIGDDIVTSGLGGLYPKGILIGQVASIHKDEGGLLKAAWIEPSARINRMEEVLVMTGPKGKKP